MHFKMIQKKLINGEVTTDFEGNKLRIHKVNNFDNMPNVIPDLIKSKFSGPLADHELTWRSKFGKAILELVRRNCVRGEEKDNRREIENIKKMME